MIKTLIYIGLGSFAGGIARYCMTRFVSGAFEYNLPLGTLAVNIAGCFLLGLLTQLLTSWQTVSPELKLMLTVGFCGGFTTFSTFVAEWYAMLSATRYMIGVGYAALSLVLGLMALWLGTRLAHLI
ncbi:MAG: fluoride efflux transporter CrcB [Muribaculum sp.]|nr:fluoride efflux transporter CrcB [Muribaculaceae bacterium]MCM1081657.1 fluoride efflux transporter CrcB [Muribaculum sp.]